MNDWLSKLEDWEKRNNDEDIRRMARVLREFEKRIKLWKALGRLEDSDLDGMSADAKELLK